MQNGAHALKLKSPAFAEEQATDEVDDLTLLEFFLEPTPAEVDIFLHGWISLDSHTQTSVQLQPYQ